MNPSRSLILFGRIISAGLRNFIRNAWISTAATAVMVVTLTILLSSFALNRSLSDTIANITKEITVSVYLNENVSREDASEIERSLKNHPNVSAVNFKNEQEALADFQETYKDDPEILAGIGITDGIFPASLEVQIVDLSEIDSVVELAGSSDFDAEVESVSNEDDDKRRKSIESIAGAQDFITLSSLVAAGVFAAIAVLIIFNTIRMAIFTRQEEINIMKLIGSSPMYIRGPFLLEASLYGVIAAMLSLVAVYSSLLVLGPKVGKYMEIDPTIDFFVEKWFLVGGATLACGALLGFISSSLALARYLRLRNW